MSNGRRWLAENMDLVQKVYTALEECVEENGMVPCEVFETFPRLFSQGSLEILIIRPGTDGDQIFLTRRPADDPLWPNQLHYPGTTLYAKDSEEKMWARLLRNELAYRVSREDFVLAGIYITTREERERGACMHAIYRANYYEDTPPTSDGKFYNLCDLAARGDVIEHHINMLRKLRLIA